MLNTERIAEFLARSPKPGDAFEGQLETVRRYEKDDELPESLQRQLAHLKRDIPNVAVLYYGGTLGMKQDEKGDLVPTDDIEQLLKPLEIKGLKDRVNTLWFQVVDRAIDSTNGRWAHWATIGYAIRKLHNLFNDEPGGINGFVVAGGTDTMAHLSCALKFILPNIGRPVITTGAQSPIFRLGSDAESNLNFAISAATQDLSGVHQAFNAFLLDGRFIHKVRDKDYNAFAAGRSSDQYGGFNADGIVMYDTAPRRNSRIVKGPELEFYPEFQEGIKVTKLSPSTPSEALLHDSLDPTCQATLLITYGAGNVRDEGLLPNELSHIDVLRLLRECEYPVVLGSPMLDGIVESPYATGAKAVAEGVEAISGESTTGASLEVKMMRCLFLASKSGILDYQKFVQQMHKNHIGEIRPPRIRT